LSGQGIQAKTDLPMPPQRIEVAGELVGQRLDAALAVAGLSLSRRQIRALVEGGGVRLNQRRMLFASRRVQRGDVIEIAARPAPAANMPHLEFHFTAADILFDEHEVIAVNKPPGLPSQATRDPAVPHVASCLEEYFRSCGRAVAPLVLVHRLDKETSGVILLARDNERATWLARQFRGREVQKRYHALCHGLPAGDDFEVRSYLSEIDRKTGRVRTVRSGGQLAVTHFHVLQRAPGSDVSLIACEPHTGRSHQIRVHLAGHGFPIVGDKFYGVPPVRPLPADLAPFAAAHHMLHAREIAFTPAPGQPVVTVRAGYPPKFAELLRRVIPDGQIS
jgi:23S rRNA pseudouridine1911/1915/1917 synthase